MPPAPKHHLQTDRLRALRGYEILDTDPEQEFDEIVKLAAAICDAPISVINFIDADRQWFKAEVGLGVRQTPLETSLCSHAILANDFVEIFDTLLDDRMSDNPLCVGDSGVRFYSGALLKTTEGLPLGTLCVLDRQPKTLTPLQRDTLRVLATQVMARLELRKSIKYAELLRQEVDHRVKNSLQTLSSFVRFATRQARSDETQAAMSTIHSRIEAIGMVHNELYRTNAGPVVDLAHYLSRLETGLRTFQPDHIALDITVEQIDVSSGQAVAVGTLVNEFVANSWKHAFPDGRPGQILISASRGAGENDVQIICADNGVGLPATQKEGSAGLGMQILAVIAAELHCKPVFTSTAEGLRISLTFQGRADEVSKSASYGQISG